MRFSAQTNLRDVEEPEQVGRRRVLGVERGAREDGVPIAAGDHEGLHAHVGAQDDLRPHSRYRA